MLEDQKSHGLLAEDALHAGMQKSFGEESWCREVHTLPVRLMNLQLQSGLGNDWWADSMVGGFYEMLLLSAKHSRSLV